MAKSRNNEIRTQFLQITDALLVWGSFALAWYLRGTGLGGLSQGQNSEQLKESINWLLYIVVPFSPLVLERVGFYERIRSKKTSAAAIQTIKSMAMMAAAVTLFAVITKADIIRLVFGLGFSISALLLFTRDRLTACRLSAMSTSADRERVLMAGSQQESEELLAQLDDEILDHWNIVQSFDLQNRPVEELFVLLKEENVSKVVFTANATQFEKVSQAVEACELQGVEAWISASFIRSQIARPTFDSLGEIPMLVLRSTPELSWELLCKSVIDRFGAAFLILLSSPLWIIAAIGIRLKSPGASVFFSQMRAGKYGRPFRMWKFRTMVANAEELLAKTKEEHGNQMNGPVFKLDRDPRVFPFGAMLRKLSIDELPQLYNVLRGDMSLVGPRPLPLYEVAAFSQISHRRRLSMKPGITCFWQAGGRNKITSFQDWVDLDLKYIDNWSLSLDFKLLFLTVPAVLFGKGAK